LGSHKSKDNVEKAGDGVTLKFFRRGARDVEMLKLTVTDSRHKTLLAYLGKDGPTSIMSRIYTLLTNI